MTKVRPTTEQLTDWISGVLDIADAKNIPISVNDFTIVTKHALKHNNGTLNCASASGPDVLKNLRAKGYKFTF